MKTTRNSSSRISWIRRWQTGKRIIIAPSGIVLFIVIILLSLGSQMTLGQGVGISETSIAPDPSSILELKWTAGPFKGFLAPRMSTANRLAIISPAQGLLVYDTNTKSFWYYDGGWKAVAATALGTANQLLGMNGSGTANEYKTLISTSNIFYTYAPGSITINTTQDINTGSSPSFTGLTVSGLLPNRGVYTGTGGVLTIVPPTFGTLGFWDRNNTTSTLTPTAVGDTVTTSGNISTTGGGVITSSGLLKGFGGATVYGGVISLNNNSTFTTNINTGSSTGAVTIGGTGTQTISVGNGTGVKTINLGSNATTSNTTILSGTSGALSLNAAAGGAVTNIGTGATTGTVSIGGTGVQNINVGASLTGASTITLGSIASITNINSGVGAINLNVNNSQPTNINTGNSSGPINIASGGTGVNTISIGNTNGGTSLIQRVGTGGFILDGVAGSAYSVGSLTTTGSITIGGTAQTGTITLGLSNGSNTLNIANGTGATTLNLANAQAGGAVNIGSGMTTGSISIGGTGLQTGAIGIGTGTGVQTLNLGSGGTGTKTINIGTGSAINAITVGNNVLGTTIKLPGLTALAGVYTDAASNLTSQTPTSGIIGYWKRDNALSLLSPSNGSDNVTTSGNISTSGTGTITSAGLLTGNSGANIIGATSLGGTLGVTGATTLGSTLGVTGLATTNGISNIGNIGTGTLATTGLASLNSAAIANNATVGGTLGVTGATTTNGITNTGNVGTGTLSTTGNTTVGGTLGVTGATTTNGITNSGNITNTADISTATLQTTGAASVGGILGVTGSTTLGNTLGVTGLTTTNGITNTGNIGTGTLSSTGLATLNSAAIANNATIGGTLGVTGATTSAGIINTGNIGTGTLSTTGAATLNSTAITNNATIGGTLGLATGALVNKFSTDGTLVGNSDVSIPTEKAVKTYVDGKISSEDLQAAYNTGNTITTNSTKGNVVIAGTEQLLVGATNGLAVTNAATVGGTLGVTGATSLGSTLGVTGATSLTTLGTSGLATLSSASVTGDAAVGGTLGLATGTTVNKFSTDGTLTGNSNTTIPTEQAIKTYVDNGLNGKISTYGSQSANYILASPDGSPGVPTFRVLSVADIPVLDWSKITTGKPTTLAGYGITDASLSTHNHAIDGLSNVTITGKANNDILQWDGIAWVNKSLSGAGIVTSESDPVVKAINGIIKSNGTTISAATAGTDYLTPTGSAASLTGFPILNQNTSGNAATATTAGTVTGTVAVANGGTGQITQQAAINALAGAVTNAQYLRGNGTNVVMVGIQASDVPTLNQNTTGTAANVTGIVTAANGGTGSDLSSGGATGDLLVANAATTFNRLPDVAAGSVLSSGGVGAAPTWSYPALTTLENYLSAPIGLTQNVYSNELASISLTPGTWLITSETTISFSPAGGSTYWNANVVLGTGPSSAPPTTAYTSGEGSSRAPGGSVPGPIQISLSKILTVGSTTVVSTYATADVTGASVVITPPNNASTPGTATGLHAVRIK